MTSAEENTKGKQTHLLRPRKIAAHTIWQRRDPSVHLRVLAQLGVLQHGEPCRDKVLLLLPDLPFYDVHGLLVSHPVMVLEDADNIRVVRVRHPLLSVREKVVHEPYVICVCASRAARGGVKLRWEM